MPRCNRSGPKTPPPSPLQIAAELGIAEKTVKIYRVSYARAMALSVTPFRGE